MLSFSSALSYIPGWVFDFILYVFIFLSHGNTFPRHVCRYISTKIYNILLKDISRILKFLM